MAVDIMHQDLARDHICPFARTVDRNCCGTQCMAWRQIGATWWEGKVQQLVETGHFDRQKDKRENYGYCVLLQGPG